MTDDNMLPIDGGETPEDPALSARFKALYTGTAAAEAGTVEACVRAVLDRAATSISQPIAPTRRRWVFGAAALAAALLVSVLMRPRAPQPDSKIVTPGTAVGAPVAATTTVEGGVRFDLRLPQGQAAKVSVIGDFNGWDAAATPMVRNQSNGEWSARVALLPGRHVYAYLVNGEQWVVDPLAPQISDTGYGPANALVVEGAK